MQTDAIIILITGIVTFICGLIAKKQPLFNNNLIPIQNLLIGSISSVIYYLVTKDFNLAITSAGLITGGVYDVVRNLKLIITNNEEETNDTDKV